MAESIIHETQKYSESTSFTAETGCTLVNGKASRIGRVCEIRTIIQLSPTLNQWNDLAIIPTGFSDNRTRYFMFVNATDDLPLSGRLDGNMLSIFPISNIVHSSTINVVAEICMILDNNRLE